MGRERPLDPFHWLTIARPRRMMIGDLMVGVVIAALACLTWTTTLRSELRDSDRAAFGILVLAIFAMQAMQWKLGSIPAGAVDSARSTLLGIASYLVGMAMFVGFVIMAFLFAEGALFVVVTMLILVVYLSTWD